MHVLVLYREHYKEYLVDRINKAKLDPLPLYDNIGVILTREEMKVPEREGEETDEDYRERLIQVCSWTLQTIDSVVSYLLHSM